MTLSKISVAMCTYNGELYISEQLVSILNQTILPDEIIISDDNSSDKTIEIAESILKDSNISYKIIVNKINIGVVRNFENAVNNTTGDIILFCDQDDVWNTEKVSIISSEFDKDPSLVMVFTNAELVNFRREKLKKNLWDTVGFSNYLCDDKAFFDTLLNRCIVTGATMAYKRKIAIKLMPFPDSWLHDGWLAINALNFGNIKAINMPLIEYRQHSKNVIGAGYVSFRKRILKYIEKTKEMQSIRTMKYNRYNSYYLANNATLEDEKIEKVLNCKLFWKDMLLLSDVNLTQGIITIMKHIIKGSYKKYYSGIRGAIRDILFLIIRED